MIRVAVIFLLLFANASLVLQAEDVFKARSPATLSGVSYYLPEFVRKVEAGLFDPEEYSGGDPQTIRFTAPGTVKIIWGLDSEIWNFKASRDKQGFALALTDPKGILDAWTAHWTWVGEKRAVTTLFSAFVPGGSQDEVMYFPKDVCDLSREYEKNFAERNLPLLVGSYADAKGSTLKVGADGYIFVDGKRIRMAVYECGNYGCVDCDEKTERAPCLILPGKSGRIDNAAACGSLEEHPAFWVDRRTQQVRLIEGTLNDFDYAMPEDYRPFQPAAAGRIFVGVK